MHAIATDPESVHRPCMYLQLDQEVSDDGGSGGEDEDGSPARPLPELRLVPADPAALDLLFAALCAGAERNPDGDAEEGQGSLFFDQDEALAGAAGAALRMSGDDVGDLVGGDPGRFDDPDDGGEDKYEEDEEAEAGTPQNGDAQ
jgi:nucleotide-sensitive chloride channel 1A